MSRIQLIDFFDRYRAAFDRLDGDAVADLWHTPSAIADSRNGCGHVEVWTADAPMRANMHALCTTYRNVGFAGTDYRLLEAHTFGPDHALAHLQWQIRHADGSVLLRFRAAYQLLRTADGLRIFGCTAYEEDLAEMKESKHAAQ